MRSLIGLFIAISFFYSCHKEMTLPDAESEMIFGEWEWYLSVNAGWGGERTPASEGYTKELIIGRTGTFTEFFNGGQVKADRFNLVKDNERIWPTPYLLAFKDSNPLMVYKLTEDTLAFYPYKFNDANIVYYKRKE